MTRSKAHLLPVLTFRTRLTTIDFPRSIFTNNTIGTPRASLKVSHLMGDLTSVIVSLAEPAQVSNISFLALRTITAPRPWPIRELTQAAISAIVRGLALRPSLTCGTRGTRSARIIMVTGHRPRRRLIAVCRPLPGAPSRGGVLVTPCSVSYDVITGSEDAPRQVPVAGTVERVSTTFGMSHVRVPVALPGEPRPSGLAAESQFIDRRRIKIFWAIRAPHLRLGA